MARFCLYSEGCLDKALSEWLLERAGHSVYDSRVGGGWSGVARNVVRHLLEAQGLDCIPIGFIDTDESLDERLSSVHSLARDEGRRRGYRVAVNRVRERPYILEARVEGLPGAGYLVLWGRPPSYRDGSVEDVLRAVIEGAWGASVECRLLGGSGCPEAGKAQSTIAKLEVLVLLAACTGSGTPAAVRAGGRVCCGVPVEELLRRHGDRLAGAQPASAYISGLSRL